MHPLATSVPPEAQVSIASVGQYIAALEPNPFLRAKALHDFVIQHLEYAMDEYRHGQISHELAEPEIVFRRRRAVCAGYARLFQALGTAASLRVAYVEGSVRFHDPRNPGPLAVMDHAWNAIEIEGASYLLDVTWNAIGIGSSYRTDYLFTPAEVFGYDHRPHDDRFQLLATPRTARQFREQPLLLPGFFALGYRLIAPDRYALSVRDRLDIDLDNLQGREIIGRARSTTGTNSVCTVSGQGRQRMSCALDPPGDYRITLSALIGRQANWTGYQAVAERRVTSGGPSAPSPLGQACVAGGGRVIGFPNSGPGCHDECVRARICKRAPSLGCDCGPKRCWNGVACIGGGP